MSVEWTRAIYTECIFPTQSVGFRRPVDSNCLTIYHSSAVVFELDSRSQSSIDCCYRSPHPSVDALYMTTCARTSTHGWNPEGAVATTLDFRECGEEQQSFLAHVYFSPEHSILRETGSMAGIHRRSMRFEWIHLDVFSIGVDRLH